MKILSWNVNSVRLRMRALAGSSRATGRTSSAFRRPRCRTASFPSTVSGSSAFRHHALAGQKSYNGVAILSRLPLEDVVVCNWCRRKDCRHLQVTLPRRNRAPQRLRSGGGRASRSGTQPEVRPQAPLLSRAHALVSRQEARLGPAGARRRPERRPASRGRLVARAAEASRHAHGNGSESHGTPRGVSRFWVDTLRHFVPAPRKLFTWWSYRAPDWKRVNKGRRLDHAWVTPGLVPALVDARVLENVRGWRCLRTTLRCCSRWTRERCMMSR